MDIWLESYRWFISALFSFQGTPPNCFGCSPFLANRLCYCIAWSFSCQAVFSTFVRQNDITVKNSCTRLTPCAPPRGDLYNDTGFSPACQHFFDFLFGKSFVLKMVSWEGLEPPTLWFVVKYSDPTELLSHKLTALAINISDSITGNIRCQIKICTSPSFSVQVNLPLDFDGFSLHTNNQICYTMGGKRE